MKILLTGATGFIGNYVLPLLIKEGYTVNTLVRKPSNLILSNHPRVNIVKGDISCSEDLNHAADGCEIVVHLAALVQATSKDSEAFRKINFQGTENILKAALKAGVKKFIFTSSISACKYLPLPVITEQSLVRPEKCFGEYAEAKADAEQLVKDYSLKGLNYIIIYPARVFGIGPLTDANGATKAIAMYMNNKLPFLINGGEQYSCWSFVEDVARGIASAVSCNQINQRYILGGQNLTLAELYHITDRITGSKHLKINVSVKTALRIALLIEKSARLTRSHPLITREWLKFLLQSQKLSSGKAIAELNYTITPIEIALEKTIRWLLNSQNRTQLKHNKIAYEKDMLAAKNEVV